MSDEVSSTTFQNPMKGLYLFLSFLLAILFSISLGKGDRTNIIVEYSIFSKLLVFICCLPSGYIGALAGDFVRKLAMPDMYFTSGFIDILKKKFFWFIGPQLIGMFIFDGIAGALVKAFIDLF